MTIYLKTNWYFICILQLAGLAKVSNMETILSDPQKMADLHTMHVVNFTTCLCLLLIYYLYMYVYTITTRITCHIHVSLALK